MAMRIRTTLARYLSCYSDGACKPHSCSRLESNIQRRKAFWWSSAQVENKSVDHSDSIQSYMWRLNRVVPIHQGDSVTQAARKAHPD